MLIKFAERLTERTVLEVILALKWNTKCKAAIECQKPVFVENPIRNETMSNKMDTKEKVASLT